jgi:hypothetical protein
MSDQGRERITGQKPGSQEGPEIKLLAEEVTQRQHQSCHRLCLWGLVHPGHTPSKYCTTIYGSHLPGQPLLCHLSCVQHPRETHILCLAGNPANTAPGHMFTKNDGTTILFTLFFLFFTICFPPTFLFLKYKYEQTLWLLWFESEQSRVKG